MKVAYEKARRESHAAMREDTDLCQICGGSPCWATCVNFMFVLCVST